MNHTTRPELLAATYSRYSTDRQSDDSTIDQQRVAAEYAAKHGLTITVQFSDAGISGAVLGNRSDLLRVLEEAEHAETRRFDLLLVNDTTRLSRSQDLGPLISRLRHKGVRVIGIQDAFDSDSRTARMQAGMSGIMSEEFRTMIADRTRSALRMRAESGRPIGGRTSKRTRVHKRPETPPRRDGGSAAVGHQDPAAV